MIEVRACPKLNQGDEIQMQIKGLNTRLIVGSA